MAGAADLAKLVPGFEFLQTLMKGASASLPGMPGVAAIPGMSQWIAPTLDPEELDKRIQELKTVQFWLEQNARLLATTIQALEVQRMTLSTLQTMNLPLADLRDALKIKLPAAEPAAAPFSASFAAPYAAPFSAPRPAPAPTPAPEPEPAPDPAPAQPAAPAVDPLQWWGALTQQFTELATQAVKDSAAEAARNLAASAVQRPAKPATTAAPPAARGKVSSQGHRKFSSKSNGKSNSQSKSAPASPLTSPAAGAVKSRGAARAPASKRKT